MNILRVVLATIFIVLAVIVSRAVYTGILPYHFLIVVVALLLAVFALRDKGGMPVRMTGYLVSVVFILLGILSLIMVLSTFFGHEYDPYTPIVTAALGLIGILNVVVLRNTTPGQEQKKRPKALFYFNVCKSEKQITERVKQSRHT